jgi:hypothetical protein
MCGSVQRYDNITRIMIVRAGLHESRVSVLEWLAGILAIESICARAICAEYQKNERRADSPIDFGQLRRWS